MMIQDTRASINQLIDNVNAHVVGQDTLVKSVVIALLADGHVLLEGLPGTAKTRAVKMLSDVIKASFNRVQFTPDLLPSDVTGTNIYDKETGKLTFQKGPIFNSIVLADEINRAPAKVQAALLEAMAEGTVTVGGDTLALPPLFMVLATQNPIEQEGTYPLPEAQMDRFLMKVDVTYPDREAEIDIIRLVRNEALHASDTISKQATQSIDIEVVSWAKEEVKHVYSSPVIDAYIADLVMATRHPDQYPNSQLGRWIQNGVSPRASIALDACSRANAWLAGRDFVTPEDVRSVAHAVMAHRIQLSFEAMSDSVSKTQIINELLEFVPISG